MRPSIGPFALVRPIGRGGMGQVWQATHPDLQAPVAVKILTAGHAARSFLDAFRDEIRAVARLDHPHVIRLYDHGLVPDPTAAWLQLPAGEHPWVAMELAGAGTLAQRIPNRWVELREVLRALLDALAHTHAREVVHRDIKPANVLLCGPTEPRPGLKLADFGIAHLGEGPGMGGGTPAFMAPEQILGEWRAFGPWTDLYALGCLTWWIVSGQLPFTGGDVLAEHLGRAPPALVPRLPVPPGLEDWLRTLLAKEPAARFRCAADAAVAVEALGEVAEEAAPGPVAKVFDLATTCTLSFGVPETPELAPLGPAAGVRPVPHTWRRVTPSPAPTELVGTGLGLWGLRRAPLRGRSAERDALWAALRDVASGSGTAAVVLRGPAGTGKSALARWLVERARELGAADAATAVFGAGAHEGLSGMLRALLRADGLPPAHRPRALASALRALGLDGPADHALVAALADPDANPVGTASDRLATVVRVLEAAARERPLIVWLDDVPWGGEGLALCGALLGRGAPVLVVLTAEDEALAERADEAAALDALERAERVTTLQIGPLGDAECGALLEDMLGLAPVLRDRVVRRAGGNALFATQLVQAWVEAGVLAPGAEGYALAAGSAPELPADLHALWQGRLARALLGRPTTWRDAVEVAAVLGSPALAEWRAACAAAGVDAPGAADHLLRSRLWVEAAPGSVRFVHGMLRESVVAQAVEAGRAARWHRACADVPGRRRGFHLLRAGAPAAAVEPLTRALQDQVRQIDPAAAARIAEDLQRALERAGLAPRDPAAVEALVALAQCKRLLRQLDEAERFVDAALDAGSELPEACVEALAIRHIVERSRGRTDEARRALRDAQLLAERHELTALLPRLHVHDGYLASSQGDTEGAVASFRQALATVRPDGTWATEALVPVALQGLASAHLVAGRLDEAEQVGIRAGEEARRLGTHNTAQQVGVLLGTVAHFRGDLEVADQRYQEVLAACTSRDSLLGRAADINRAVVLVDRGRHGSALRIVERHLARCERRGELAMACQLHALALACAAGLDDPSGFRRSLDRLEELLPTSGLTDPGSARVVALSARLWEEAGREVEAGQARTLAAALYEGLGA